MLDAGAVEFLLLGPPEVRVAGRSIPIGGRRQQAVLVLFALNPGRLLTTEWLVDQLWSGSAPPSGVATLRSYISRLRATFEAEAADGDGEVLVRQGSGYSLVAEPERIDIRRFDRSIDEASAAMTAGTPDEARSILRRALALWRGPVALGDLAYEPFAIAESLRLTERRLEATELCIDAELALSRHREVVGELQRLVAEYPLRERFWQQLMLTLYRSSRQAEALAVYEQLRRHLIEEMGLEPAPETRRLEELILGQSAELELRPLPTPVRSTAAASAQRVAGGLSNGATRSPERRGPLRLPLVGRDLHLGELGDTIAGDSGSAVRLAVVVGEGGCGKTRLLSELADRAGRDGFVVARGTADDEVLPYSPFGAIVRSLLDRNRAPESTAGIEAPYAEELAWLVPEIGRPPVGDDPDLARARLTEGVVHLLRTVAPDRPLLLLVDDAHRMGATGCSLLRTIVDRAWPRPLAVVVAGRPPDDPDTSNSLLQWLLRHEDVATVDVLRLSEDEIVQLVRALDLGSTPAETERTARLLFEHSGGIPLLVRELVATLQEGSEIDASALAERGRTSALIKAVIGSRVAGLSGPARRIVEAASISGADIDAFIVAEVSGRSPSEVIDGLEEALRVGLVVEQHRHGHFAFDHSLVRGYVAGQISSTRRDSLHAAAAIACGLRGMTIEAADHALASVDSLGLELAAGFVIRGAWAALSSLDFERSRDMSTAMIRQWADELVPDILIELMMVGGKASALAGHAEEAEKVWARAADLARGVGDPDRFAEVALNSDAYGQIFTGSELRWRLLSEARETASASRNELRLAVLTAWAGDALSRPDQVVDQAELRAILTEAEAADDPELSMVVCHTKGTLASGLRERRHWWKRLEDEASTACDVWLTCRGIFGQLSVEAAEGDGDAIARRLADVAARLEARDHPALRWCYEAAACSWARIRGSFDEADVHAATAADVGQRFGIPDAVQGTAAHHFLTAFHRGTLVDLYPVLVESADHALPAAMAGIPAWYFAIGLVRLSGGDEAGAWECLAGGLGRLRPERSDDLWEMTLCLAAEVAAGLQHAPTTELAAARARLQRDLAPRTGTFAVGTMFSAEFGPVDRSLALLASARGLDRLADRHFEKAVAACQRMGAVTWALRTQVDRCAAAVKAGRPPGDLEPLRRQIGEAGLAGALAALEAGIGQRSGGGPGDGADHRTADGTPDEEAS